MKKIILLKSGIDHLGGLEKYTLRLAKAFSDTGADVTLLTSGAITSQTKAPNVEFISTSLKSFTSAGKVLEFDRFCTKFLTENKADVIFGLDRNTMQTHIRAGNGCHAAYLYQRKTHEGLFKAVTFEINPLHQRILSLEKTSFSSSELKVLFTNSHMVKDQIQAFYGIDENKLCVIHNGVEWQEHASLFENSLPDRKHILDSLRLPSECHHFLFAGHNFQRKGLVFCLQALQKLHQIPFHLSVVGYDKQLSSYKKIVEKMGLENCVTFFGPRKDMNTFYTIADTLIIPSLYDPFANVTLEALSMGVFVVTSKHNGAKEVLKPEAGVVIDDLFDPDSFAQALFDATANPKTNLKAKAVRSSISHLDFHSQLTKMVNITLGK